jgi:hypothetical protein
MSNHLIPSSLRFALATLLSKLSFRVCPSEFNVRFCEEVDELIDKAEPLNTWTPEENNNWSADGTRRLPSEWLRW